MRHKRYDLTYARILIIGGTGSLGKKLFRRYLPRNNTVLIYSRDESKHWTIKNDLKSAGLLTDRISFCVGDIRDTSRLSEVIRDFAPTVIIIAAALKHVDTCELSPLESIKTNLLGTQSVLDAITSSGATEGNLRKVVFVSTDKACAPVNSYGMCKALSERLITSKSMLRHSNIDYLCTRYGNVLESRGSIIPLFKHQAQNQDYITVTDDKMTRFVMTLDDSVDLITLAIENGVSGDTWIPKIKSMRVIDLANIFSRRYDKPIKIIGQRPGEKLHEDLINMSESARTRELSHNYVIAPAHANVDANVKQFDYSSGDPKYLLTEAELEKYLEDLGVFSKSMDDFEGLKIEEIMK